MYVGMKYDRITSLCRDGVAQRSRGLEEVLYLCPPYGLS